MRFGKDLLASLQVSDGAALQSRALGRFRRGAIATSALLFVSLTVWQVSAQRDDWPLSSFEMYSGLQGTTASRSVVKGVSEDGEFDLASGQIGPFGGARLRHLNGKLAGSPKRRARFLRVVQARYDAERQSSGAPVLQALRSYSETWRIRPRLEGIEHPHRRRTGSTYLPPSALLSRLELERSGRAEPPVHRERGAGDQVLEAALAMCGGACSEVEDAAASGRGALELGNGGSISGTVELGAGTWSVFVRMKTLANQGTDRLSVSLDGKRVGGGQGIGNYREWLGHGAWVWASAAPGEPALELKVPVAGTYNLKLGAKKGPVRIDQVWLARTRRELPITSDPVK